MLTQCRCEVTHVETAFINCVSSSTDPGFLLIPKRGSELGMSHSIDGSDSGGCFSGASCLLELIGKQG